MEKCNKTNNWRKKAYFVLLLCVRLSKGPIRPFYKINRFATQLHNNHLLTLTGVCGLMQMYPNFVYFP